MVVTPEKDPFLFLDRKPRPMKVLAAGTHHERKHSKFSASGAERWFNCPGSVELSEGLPDKSSKWAQEGTHAHEVLEAIMRVMLSGNDLAVAEEQKHILQGATREMIQHASNLTKFLFKRAEGKPSAEILCETRVTLDFIHPEMFGTFDAAIVDYFGTLDVVDYKYGAGVPVAPHQNLQMIFYALGLAHIHHWNFKRVRVWIDQPRVKGYDGPAFWEIRTMALMPWRDIFKKKVQRVIERPDEYVEGSWCHWCRAKGICPLKVGRRLERARGVFAVPV